MSTTYARRSRKKTRIGHPIRLILILLILIALVVGGYLGVRHILGSGYSDERGFIKYADSLIEKTKGEADIYPAQPVYNYGEPLSFATAMPSTDCPAVDEDLSTRWEARKVNFEQENQALGDNGQGAVVMGYEAYGSPFPVNGLAIHNYTYKKVDGEPTLEESVDCYNIATKANAALLPAQVFMGDYESVIKEKGAAALQEAYGKDLNEGYEEQILSATEKFILTQDGVRFFFDSGTILPAEEGAPSFTLSYDDLSGVLRDKIGERVIDPSKPMVAVTYDDGPSADCTPQLLDLYEKNNAVCTFFELGECVDQVENSSEILKRELGIGCEVGCHSYSHPNLFELDDAGIQDQADRCIGAIEKATGQKPTIMRAPYGNGNDHIAEIFGLPCINWNVDTMDWSSLNAEAVVSSVQSYGDLDGSIILMHSIYQSTVDASQTIVPWLIEQGYQLVTVSELLEYKYGQNPVPVKDFGYTFMDES